MALPYQLHQKVTRQQQQTSSSNSTSSSFDFKILQKPFWIWDKKDHLQAVELSEGQCCWNHIVGLPVKDGKEYPLFDYEQTLFNALMYDIGGEHRYQNKHLWVK